MVRQTLRNHDVSAGLSLPLSALAVDAARSDTPLVPAARKVPDGVSAWGFAAGATTTHCAATAASRAAEQTPSAFGERA